MADCPLCQIYGKEHVLCENELIFIVKTKNLKGHQVRMMAVTKRHTNEPTFEETASAYAMLSTEMAYEMRGENWFIVSNHFSSLKEHWHLMACDVYSDDTKEMEQLHSTPRVLMPIPVIQKMAYCLIIPF